MRPNLPFLSSARNSTAKQRTPETEWQPPSGFEEKLETQDEFECWVIVETFETLGLNVPGGK